MTAPVLTVKRLCSRLVATCAHERERFHYRRIFRRRGQRVETPERDRAGALIYPRCGTRYLLGGGRDFPEVAAAFRELFPRDAQTRIHQADLVCEHVFDLLGSGPTRLSPPGPSYRPIDWHTDFKSGYRWSPREFYRDIGLGPIPGVDVKIPWELSRFQHLHALGQAHTLTGHSKYRLEFRNQIDDWIGSNPPGFGVNWTCPMEVAIRAANWLVAAEYFPGEDVAGTSFHHRFYTSVHEHGSFIYRNLERYREGTTNHYLADIVGLLFIAVYCPFLQESSRWLRFCVRELAGEMERQVYADGCHFEASTCYHRLALELFFCATLLVVRRERRAEDDYRQATQKLFGPEYTDRLHRMFRAVLHLLKPNGRMPQVGDNDSGRFQAFAPREVLDMRYLLALGAVFFHEPAFKVREFGFSEDVMWLFGPRGYDTWKSLPERSVATIESRSFPQAGWHVMRHNCDYCLVSCGSNGVNGKGGHAHNDKLSIELALNGRDVVLDPGTYTYTARPQQRNRFRSTACHNTVQVDGCEQDELPEDDVFRLSHRVSVRRAELTQTAGQIRFEGEIRYGGIVHWRAVALEKKTGRWRIEDRIVNPKPLGAEARFHLCPDVICDGGYIFEKSAGLAPARIETGSGRIDVRTYDYSPEYGVLIKAPCICIRLPDGTRPAVVTWFCRGGTEQVGPAETQALVEGTL